MASKRMFSLDIVDSDAYLDLPFSAQALYVHICMRADDYGLIDNAKKILRITRCKDADLKRLVNNGFLLDMGSGIYAVKHWNKNNNLRNDRQKVTYHMETVSRLEVDKDGCYRLTDDCHTTDIPMTDNGMSDDIPQTYQALPNDTLGIGIGIDIDKGIGLGKGKGEEEGIDIPPFIPPTGGQEPAPHKSATTMIEERQFSIRVEEAVKDWVKYKTEKRQAYKETGLKCLLTEIENRVRQHGEQAVIDVIRQSMGNNWQGIAWDRIKKSQQELDNDYLQRWLQA